MVSMKDISAACGVSVATVSKALNDHRDVSEETKRRIRQVAKEMGYFPNSSARILKTNKSFNIGVLFVDQEPQSGLTHEYFSNILDSFKNAVEAKGYDITFINCNKDRKGRLSYLEHSKFRGVDGVLVACVNFEDPEVIELVKSDMPVVTIDYSFVDRLSVTSDNTKGMTDLLEYVYAMGHRKIAYIHGQKESDVTGNRLKGFRDTAGKLGIETKNDYIIAGNYRDIPNAAKNTSILLNMKERPTCIVYSDDYSAIGGINEIKARGLTIPDDISVVGYDGINIAIQMEPKLTTVAQDTRAIGSTAADRLIDIIERPAIAKTEHIVIEGTLIRGSSVRDIN